MKMQEQKFSELEKRASAAVKLDDILRLEAGIRVREEIEKMRSTGEAVALSDEEMGLLQAFRRFKLRMRSQEETFTWRTNRPEGVQLVEETAEIVHPTEGNQLIPLPVEPAPVQD